MVSIIQSTKESMEIGKARCTILSAGNWQGDGGAAYGILPRKLWKKFSEPDNYNRILLDLNCLLVQTNDSNTLIDTGIGNKFSDKIQKIYKPTEFTLLKGLDQLGVSRYDIDRVILTHLHFDHAGGVISRINNSLQITFPNAIHIVQKSEWEMAKKPDELNQTVYDFVENLELLEKKGKVLFVDGDYVLSDEISVYLAGGHSCGNQVVRIESNGNLGFFASDLFPLEPCHRPLITSSYDLCREKVFWEKKKIIDELEERGGVLFFSHDIFRKYIAIGNRA